MILYPGFGVAPELSAVMRTPAIPAGPPGTKMKIVHKYLLAESVGPFLIGLFTFSLVMLLQRFAPLADMVIAKNVPPSLVARLFLSLFPACLEFILPAALFLAIMLALGRLGADSETTALQAAGIGMRGFLPPVILLCGASFLGSLFIVWSGVPWGNRHLQETMAGIISVRAGAGTSEHVFQEIAPDVLLFPDRVFPDGLRMGGVLLSQRIAGKEPLLTFAKDGEFLPANGGKGIGLSLSDGTIHQEDTLSGIYRVASFRRMEYFLPTGPGAGVDSGDPNRMTLPELSRNIATLGNTGRGASYRHHFHRRLSLAVSCISFGLFALPLGLFQRARGKSPAFALTVVLILVFYLFLAASRAMVSRSPDVMVMLLWMPNVAVLAASCWILKRSDHRVISMPVLSRGGRLKR